MMISALIFTYSISAKGKAYKAYYAKSQMGECHKLTKNDNPEKMASFIKLGGGMCTTNQATGKIACFNVHRELTTYQEFPSMKACEKTLAKKKAGKDMSKFTYYQNAQGECKSTNESDYMKKLFVSIFKKCNQVSSTASSVKMKCPGFSFGKSNTVYNNSQCRG